MNPMSYEPTNWKSGDVVTSAKLNKLEQGVADACGGLIVHASLTFDKTSDSVVLSNVEETIDEILAAIAEGRPVEMHVARADYEQDPHTDFMVYRCDDAYTGDAESTSLTFKNIYIDIHSAPSVEIITHMINYADSAWTYEEKMIEINV